MILDNKSFASLMSIKNTHLDGMLNDKQKMEWEFYVQGLEMIADGRIQEKAMYVNTETGNLIKEVGNA